MELFFSSTPNYHLQHRLPPCKTLVSLSHHLHMRPFPCHLTFTYLKYCIKQSFKYLPLNFQASAAADASFMPATGLEKAGGRMVVELVGAFNELTERMNELSTSSSHILFKSLKLSIPVLLSLPPSHDGRSLLSKAMSVALVLADLQFFHRPRPLVQLLPSHRKLLLCQILSPESAFIRKTENKQLHKAVFPAPNAQMDAEVISAGILREVMEAGLISMHEVRNQIGPGTAHLLHESLRVMQSASKIDDLDDDSAAAFRKFCLTYYDIRAVILDLAWKLDTMRNLDYMPRYQQQILSLMVMKIHAPLAHAVGANVLSLELEDLSFRYLFPCSYLYVDAWLRRHEMGSKHIDMYKDQVIRSLKRDRLLDEMVEDISVKGRYKSRYSTMKKLLKDGRKPEEVNDVIGLRVVLTPRPGTDMSVVGERACYRTQEIIRSMWKEFPHRTKDYISRPKENGYKSLHMAVDVSEDDENRPLMEIQIRTKEMDELAAGGIASHSLYKSGVTDPEEAKHLKAVMMAAAELAALRLKELSSTSIENCMENHGGRVFCLLDKNGDGRISVEELMEVMEELGASGEDAREMMRLLDSNSDGSLSSEEFDLFQRQVEFMRNMEDRDERYKAMLNKKLQIAREGCLS